MNLHKIFFATKSALACFALWLSSSSYSLTYAQDDYGANKQGQQNASIDNAGDPILAPSNAPNPPDLPKRRLPTPHAVPLSQSGAFAQGKASLAWRQKVMKLSLDKYKTSTSGDNNNPLLRSFTANFSDTMMALANSCANAGFKVESFNSNAGEILASAKDSNSRLVFSIWEQPDGKTWVSAGTDRGNSSSNLKNASFILDTAANTISKRGRI